MSNQFEASDFALSLRLMIGPLVTNVMFFSPVLKSSFPSRSEPAVIGFWAQWKSAPPHQRHLWSCGYVTRRYRPHLCRRYLPVS